MLIAYRFKRIACADRTFIYHESFNFLLFIGGRCYIYMLRLVYIYIVLIYDSGLGLFVGDDHK